MTILSEAIIRVVIGRLVLHAFDSYSKDDFQRSREDYVHQNTEEGPVLHSIVVVECWQGLHEEIGQSWSESWLKRRKNAWRISALRRSHG